MLYFQLLAVAAVFLLIAWLATGRGGQIGETHPDRPDVALPDDRQLRKTDIDATRFTVGWRGYRMDEVDHVLDRLAAEIDYRDRLIAELLPQGHALGAGVEYQPVARTSEAGSSGSSESTVSSGTETIVLPDAAETDADAEFGLAESASAETTGTAEPADPASEEDNPLSSWYRKPE